MGKPLRSGPYSLPPGLLAHALHLSVGLHERMSEDHLPLIRGALKDCEGFPEGVRSICLAALTIVAEGGKPDVARPLHGLGSGVFEIALPFRGDAFRAVYAAQPRKGTGVNASPRNPVRVHPQPSLDRPREPAAHAPADPSRLSLPRHRRHRQCGLSATPLAGNVEPPGYHWRCDFSGASVRR